MTSRISISTAQMSFRITCFWEDGKEIFLNEESWHLIILRAGCTGYSEVIFTFDIIH
jgi:hypothetical protein